VNDRDIDIMIRPSAVRLCAADRPDRQMVGTVTDVAFRGRGYEDVVELAEGNVELAEGNKVTGVFDDARFARGDTVGLMIEPGGCMAFPVQDPSASATPQEGSGPEAGAEVRAQDLGGLAVVK
jgi:iron(III) transport system ATP-binding protein